MSLSKHGPGEAWTCRSMCPAMQRDGPDCVRNGGMKRDRLIAVLKAHERDIRARGAKSLYLFGSALRGEATRRSDVDLFIDYDRRRKFSLIDQVGLKQYLEDLLDREVDLLTRDGLHRTLRPRIEAEALRVL